VSNSATLANLARSKKAYYAHNFCSDAHFKWVGFAHFGKRGRIELAHPIPNTRAGRSEQIKPTLSEHIMRPLFAD
jgi:hypothetical protein